MKNKSKRSKKSLYRVLVYQLKLRISVGIKIGDYSLKRNFPRTTFIFSNKIYNTPNLLLLIVFNRMRINIINRNGTDQKELTTLSLLIKTPLKNFIIINRIQ